MSMCDIHNLFIYWGSGRLSAAKVEDDDDEEEDVEHTSNGKTIYSTVMALH